MRKTGGAIAGYPQQYLWEKSAGRFTSHPSLQGLPVVDNGQPTGLIMREKFFAKLASGHGFSQYLNRPVTFVMDNHPLTVDYESDNEMVSKLAMARREDTLYDYVAVLKDSNYHGIVTVRDLLVKLTDKGIT